MIASFTTLLTDYWPYAVPALAVVLVVGVVFWYRRPKPLKINEFQSAWQALQKQLRDKTKWATVVVDADKLLDAALKRRRVRGRTMGARLVRAQRLLSDNDSVWFGHKLRNKIDADPATKLRESDVKQALLGIRQALKDIGALPNGK